MINKDELAAAIAVKEEADKVINQYYKEEREIFDNKMKTSPIFTEDELFYSSKARCPCGAGLAYPKDCGANHYWDCSAILKGTADKEFQHTSKMQFSMYSIKVESDHNGTTREDNKS